MNNIQNTTYLSKRAYLLFYWYSLRRNIHLLVILLLMTMFFAMILYSAMRVPGSIAGTFPIFFLLPVILLYVVLIGWLGFMLPQITYKKLKATVNNFLFEDEGVRIATQKPGANAQGAFAYRNIPKVIERKDAFYLYIDRRQAFIVEKQGFIQGDAGQLAELFRNRLGSRFR